MKKHISPPMAHVPSFSLYGDGELIMEGKFKLIDYSKTRIAVDVNYKNKLAVIQGDALSIRVAAENVLSFSGKISSFALEDLKEDKK